MSDKGKKWLMSLPVGTILAPEWAASLLCIGHEGIHWLGGDDTVPGCYEWCFIHDDEGSLGTACPENCPVVGGLFGPVEVDGLGKRTADALEREARIAAAQTHGAMHVSEKESEV